MDGRHSAPATANPSPNQPNNPPNRHSPGNPTGASPAGANTPAGSGPNDSSSNNVNNNPPGAANGVNGVQRPNTAPVSVTEQISNLGPDLFVDLGLNAIMGGTGFDDLNSLNSYTEFDRDFGQWFDPN